MSTDMPTYVVSDALPSIAIEWTLDGAVLDFSSGWTFRLRVGRNNVAVLEKTSGITGAATSPNITIDWAVGELATLTGDLFYAAQLRAVRTSDSKPRTYPFQLQILREMGAVPSP